MVDAAVNGKPAVLLLDTGARVTILSAQMTNQVVALAKAARLQPRLGQNSDGQYVKTNAELNLGGRVLPREVLAMNLDGLAEKMGATHVDGVLGADVLQEFSALRIDYKNHTLELEK